MMADPSDSSLQFFSKAVPLQWKWLLGLYGDVLKLRAAQIENPKKAQELIRLDNWYQETLPKQIHSRKDPKLCLTHEELVQVTKWKLMRGKSRPRLLDLVRINTELAVKQATQKAFKKLPNLSAAITALTNLKGIGPATASAVITAGAPEQCPYMADESMLSTPGVEATDYTIAEFVNYAEQIKTLCERIKEQDPEGKWNPHKIELCLWTHYTSKQLKPELLDAMPKADGSPRTGSIDEPNDTDLVSSTENSTTTNGKSHHPHDEDSNISVPASDVDDKSNDSSSLLQNETPLSSSTNNNSSSSTLAINNGHGTVVGDASSTGDNSNGAFRHPATGNGAVAPVSSISPLVDDNAREADDSNSKDGAGGDVVPSSEENSRNDALFTEDNSNLSNLSSGGDDVTTTTSGGDYNSTNDSNSLPTSDEPALKKIRAE